MNDSLEAPGKTKHSQPAASVNKPMLHIHISSAQSLKRVERWPGCGVAVFCRVTLGVLGLALSGVALAHHQQYLQLDVDVSAVNVAGILGGILIAAGLFLPSRWCRKLGATMLP